ncbi:hypothetical protein BJX70DRAFT_79349 [Aspergillus crustosus]
MIFRHWKTDELLRTDVSHDVPDRRHHYARMHRATLQQALLRRVPRDVIHLGKKVDHVKVAREQGATVTFTDGTSMYRGRCCHRCRWNQMLRQAFVSNHELTWLGDVVLRSTFDYSAVEDIKEIHQDSSNSSGPTGFFFGTRLGSDRRETRMERSGGCRYTSRALHELGTCHPQDH